MGYFPQFTDLLLMLLQYLLTLLHRGFRHAEFLLQFGNILFHCLSGLFSKFLL